GGINLRAGRDDGRGMNAAGKSSFREKQCHGLGEGDPRVRHANQDFFRRGKALVRDDGGGGAIYGAVEKVLIFGKSEVAGSGGVGRGKAFESGRSVTKHFTFKMFCYFCGGKG